MGLTKLSIRRPVTVLMVILIVLVIGFVSFSNVQIDMLPKMELPYVVISTSYSNAGPYEVESLVSETIEGAVSAVSGVEAIYSTSSEGNSMVIIEFSDGTDLDFATLDVREKLDLVKRALPSDAGNPMIIKMNPNMMPIAMLALTDSARDQYEITALTQDTIVPRLERIMGVASVSAGGIVEQEIKIIMDPYKMSGYGVTSSTIAGLLMTENINSAGGSVTYGDRELNVRSMGEINSVQEIADLPIPLSSGGYIRLSDVAQVRLGDVEKKSFSRINGRQAVTLAISKQADGNTVNVSKLIRQEVDQLMADYPGLDILFSFDSAQSIEDSIKSVAQSAIGGAILAVFILLIFLKKIKSTLVIATSIPISIITTFILIYFSGTTINIISLGGLALGVGMLVDNSIVVLENISRHDSMGYKANEAAIKGTGEVFQAILASTLTTVVVFLPMIFVKGIAGQIFKDMALTVSFSLAASLVVAITLVPMLFSKIFKNRNKDVTEVKELSDADQHKLLMDEYRSTAPYTKNKHLNRVAKWWDRVMLRVYAVYERLLRYSLDNKRKVVTIAVLLLVVSLVSVAFTGFELMPESDAGQIDISIELPKDAQLEQTNEIATQVESIMLTMPEADRVTATTSSSFFAMGGGGSNTASVTVVLTDQKDRKLSTKEVAENVRKSLKDVTGAKITVTEAASFTMGMSGDAVTINVTGPNYDVLEQIAEQAVFQISTIDGIRNPETSLSGGKPEARLYIEREKAMSYGLTGSQIASAVRLALVGSVATTVKGDGQELDVRLMYPDDVNATYDQLKYINIRTPMGSVIPLESVATITEDLGPTSVSRINQQRYISITAQNYGRDTGGLNREVKQKLSMLNLPEGYAFDSGEGQYAMMTESFSQLGGALLLAILLVYMIMAAQFESLLYPFVIIFSVPFAAVGALLLLFFTGQSINMVVFVGFIMLAGIVVNNAIVLVDYVNRLRRERGLDIRAALLVAGPIRLRPILMTTLTTVIGLVPMAIATGDGAQMSQPLAITVIGGLISSTFLTLIIVPIVYNELALLSTKEGREQRRKDKEQRKKDKAERAAARKGGAPFVV